VNLACIINSDKGKKEQELKAKGKNLRKECTMDLRETKQKSQWKNAIAMVFSVILE
jgi:hypothetical protein